MSTSDDVSADYAVAPAQAATAVTMAVIGVVELVVALFFSSGLRAVVVLVVSCLFMAAFWGLFMWLSFRARLARRRADMPVIERYAGADGRRAVQRGVVSAVAAVVAVNLVAGVLALMGTEGTDQLGITLGIVLGAAVWLTLQARDLRRWEAEHGLTLFTRSGRRRFAWTADQAQAQLVLVRAG